MDRWGKGGVGEVGFVSCHTGDGMALERRAWVAACDVSSSESALVETSQSVHWTLPLCWLVCVCAAPPSLETARLLTGEHGTGGTAVSTVAASSVGRLAVLL